MKLSKRANRLLGQQMFSIKARAEGLERKGKNLIHFEIGDPYFNAPESVKRACIKAIKQNKTHYVPSKGLYELRNEIAKTNSIDIENVLIAPANFCIFISLSLICDEGDEIVIPNPGFPTYKAVAKYLNLKIKYKPTKNTKLIIHNSPNNPTGKISELKNADDRWMVFDDVYYNIKYGDTIERRMFNVQKTIIIHSFSKSHAMSGFRLGYMIAPKEIVEKGSLLIETTVSCFPAFIQWAGIEALKVNNYKIEELTASRNLMYKGLKELNYELEEPEGAIYCWVKVKNSKDFFEWALKRGVVVCPGEVFGKKNYVRFCFAKSIKDINEGLRKIR